MLGKAFAVRATKTIVGPPRVALVFHQEQQTATCMSEVGEASLWVPVFAAPPRKDVPA